MKNIEIELTEKLKKRFLNKFKKSNDEECWNWLSSIGKGGYGRFAVGLKKKNHKL